jgi:hypothetical protein
MADVFTILTVVSRASCGKHVLYAVVLQRHFVNTHVKSLIPLYSVSCVTSVFGPVVGKCLIHHISTLHAYRAYSFYYITLGYETIFLAFSRFGVTVPRNGAEAQSM